MKKHVLSSAHTTTERHSTTSHPAHKHEAKHKKIQLMQLSKKIRERLISAALDLTMTHNRSVGAIISAAPLNFNATLRSSFRRVRTRCSQGRSIVFHAVVCIWKTIKQKYHKARIPRMEVLDVDFTLPVAQSPA